MVLVERGKAEKVRCAQCLDQVVGASSLNSVVALMLSRMVRLMRTLVGLGVLYQLEIDSESRRHSH